MTCKIIHLDAEADFVGRAVCAIGVFDGVHLGHQALVRRAAKIAKARSVDTYAVTFDRDPDQIITPDSAAPQLLTLADKARLLCDAGVTAVLVVPFTEQVAALSPHDFLTEVLLSAVDPVAMVVGEDFRFGHLAQGSVETLVHFSEAHGVEVVAHALVEADGAPVTSTRIRSLVAAGDVESASRLLGRAHRVAGTVVRGRGEGASIGVPTANIEPVEFAALPGAGVYAGCVIAGERAWPAAISVGRPPTFPDATDVLEAHLIGFTGHLYGADITVGFFERLRDQRRFDSRDELLAAMRADIETAEKIAARILPPQATYDEYDEVLDDGTPVVDDPAALEAAEHAVAQVDTAHLYELFDESWVEVLGPTSLGGLMTSGAVTAFVLTAPLSAAGIPFVWQPFPPEEQQNVRPDFNYWLRFRLYVPPEHAAEAARLLHTSTHR